MLVPMRTLRPLLLAALTLPLLSACAGVTPPRITTFEAFPRTISTPGERVTLSWTLQADPATIVTLSAQTGEPDAEPTVTEVSGQTLLNVTPEATTTYTLSATSVGGSAEQSVTVELVPEAGAARTTRR